jgi:hypothetical protein
VVRSLVSKGETDALSTSKVHNVGGSVEGSAVEITEEESDHHSPPGLDEEKMRVFTYK